MSNLFANASRITINGGNFSAIQGHAYFGGNHSERQGLTLLLDYVVPTAFYDAAERGDPPRCHPDTRKTILAEIMAWVKIDPKSLPKLLLWLNGPAGAGKTAIAQTIAEMCAEQGLLAASFFFSRTNATSNGSSHFVPSIAYQLSLSIPPMRDHLFAAIERDPTIFARSIATQVRALIVGPLNVAATKDLDQQDLSVFPRLMLVDGLDECQDENVQQEILEVLSLAIAQLRIPIFLLVASRPEYIIRETMNDPNLHPITKSLGLYEDYEAEKDVETFLRASFGKIKATHPAVRHLDGWPPESYIRYFVEMSSRQFIYAATIVKYTQSPRHNPATRLKILRGLSEIPAKDTPFSQLDALYSFILASVEDWTRVSEILTLLILNKNIGANMPITYVENVFGYDPGDVRVALTDMHALVSVPVNENVDMENIDLHHASMRDFLIDPLRSGPFYIDPPKGSAHLSVCCLQSMMRLFRASDPPVPLLYNLMSDFIQYYRKSYLTTSLFSALQHFTLPSKPTFLYALPWQKLLDVLKRNDASRLSTYPRVLGQFDRWIHQHFSQYPSNIQTCISAAYTVYGYQANWGRPSVIGDIFSVLLYSSDATERGRIKALDDDLLYIRHSDSFKVLWPFFTDPVRSGRYFPTRTNFVALAKALAGNIKKFYAVDEERVDGLARGFYKILSYCGRDVELATFLRDCMGPFDPGTPYLKGRWTMAVHVLQYIQECNIRPLLLPRIKSSDRDIDSFEEQFR